MSKGRQNMNDEQRVQSYQIGHTIEHIIIIFLLIVMLVCVSVLLKVSSPTDLREGKFLVPTNAYYNALEKPLTSPTK